MSGFIDIPLPFGIKGYPTSGAPRFSTTIVAVSSGAEQRNQNWRHPLHRYTLAEAVRDHATYTAAAKHWLAMRGPLMAFSFRDPLDFASVDLPAANFAPDLSATDVVIGTGNGSQNTFQLTKPYSVINGIESETYDRDITLPVVSTVRVALNGVELPSGPSSFTVARETGIVTITPAPANTVVVTAGFLFDVPVRFEADDTFEGIVRNYRVSGFADMTLVETRRC